MIATARPSKRRKQSPYRRISEKCRQDVGFFGREFIGNELWGKGAIRADFRGRGAGQRGIKHSVRKYRRTYVESGHGVGKTNVIADIILEFMTFPRLYADHPLPPNPSVRVVLTAGTSQQVHDVAWREVRALFRKAERNGSPLAPSDSMLTTSWEINPQWSAMALTVGEPEAIQGKHADIVLLVVDEGEHDDIPWDALKSLRSPANARELVCFNPIKTSGHCHEMMLRPDVVSAITVSCLDHPNVVQQREVIPGAVSYEWVEEIREEEGEDSPFWQSRVLARAPEASHWSLVTRKWLEAALGADGIATPEPRRLGLDVARGGGDKCVLGITDEWRNLIHLEHWNGDNLTFDDLMQTAARTREAAIENGVSLRNGDVKVDVGGMGAGVADRLEQLGVSVDRVDFGAGAIGDWASTFSRDMRFRNRKAELHWAFRVAVRNGTLKIPKRYTKLWSQACAVRYVDNDRGIEMEPKEKTKKRLGGESPDFLDMMVVLLSNAGKKPELVSFA